LKPIFFYANRFLRKVFHLRNSPRNVVCKRGFIEAWGSGLLEIDGERVNV